MLEIKHAINDGTPHMTYQRPGVPVNFVWDGKFENPIMVCVGGYAEPPTDTIEMRDMDFGGDPLSVMVRFQRLCDAYLDNIGGNVVKLHKEEQK